MRYLLPVNYGFAATDPETYVAMAVMDFIDKADPAAIHLSGEITKEYAGMLCAYALTWRLDMVPDDKPLYKTLKIAAENYDPLKVSDKLIGFIKDAVEGEE